MSNPYQWERGDVLISDRSDAGDITILGGPNYIGSRMGDTALWTVKYNQEMAYQAMTQTGAYVTRTHPVGWTRVMDSHSMHAFGYHKSGKDAYLASAPNVITNWCSECEIDDMIHYEGDYMCAWCRETLEDGYA